MSLNKRLIAIGMAGIISLLIMHDGVPHHHPHEQAQAHHHDNHHHHHGPSENHNHGSEEQKSAGFLDLLLSFHTQNKSQLDLYHKHTGSQLFHNIQDLNDDFNGLTDSQAYNAKPDYLKHELPPDIPVLSNANIILLVGRAPPVS